MRVGALLAPLLVIGCDPVANTFEVQAAEAASAELQLCGQVTSLERSEEKLTATRAITCEGLGTITVRFSNRPPVSCPDVYVTPGAVMSFRFKVDGDRCSLSDVGPVRMNGAPPK